MAEDIFVPVLTASITVLTVGLTYVFQKKKEIDASIRQKKAEMYDELVRSLTVANANTHWTDEKEVNQFILAYYRASAYASQEVIEACSQLLTTLENPELKLKLDLVTDRINAIYNSVRKDINKRAPTFNFRAFSSFKQPAA
jgi:hypothetical protein